MQNCVLPVTLCVTLSSLLAILSDYFSDNKNSVKFTSSREDNSTTNDTCSMVIKLHMHNFICTQTLCINFREVSAKLSEKSSGQNCVNGQTDGQPWRFQYTPLHFVVGGIMMQTQGYSIKFCSFHRYQLSQLAFSDFLFFFLTSL